MKTKEKFNLPCPDPEGCKHFIDAIKLDAYRQYVESNLERIVRDGWVPVCFAEFCQSEEYKIYLNNL